MLAFYKTKSSVNVRAYERQRADILAHACGRHNVARSAGASAPELRDGVEKVSEPHECGVV